MTLLPIKTRVKFGSKDTITGTIVGYGTMFAHGGMNVIQTYAVRLDADHQGKIPCGSYVSTLLVCADGLTKI